jgi:hypothetical protein
MWNTLYTSVHLARGKRRELGKQEKWEKKNKACIAVRKISEIEEKSRIKVVWRCSRSKIKGTGEKRS